jgi:hypothetical protein
MTDGLRVLGDALEDEDEIPSTQELEDFRIGDC